MGRILFTALLIGLAGTTMHAQWTQTSGPTGASVYAVTVDGTSPVAFTTSGVWVDHGGTWTRTGDPIYLTDPIVAGDYIFANVQQKLRRTSDWGATWETVTTPTGTQPVSLSAQGPMLYAVCDSTLYASSDAGASWEPRGSTGMFMSVDAVGIDTLIGVRSMFGYAPRTLTRSVDGGRTWTDLNDRMPGAPFSFEATARNRTRLYVQVNDTLLATTDLGEHWRFVAAGDSALTNGTLLQIDERAQNDIWALIEPKTIVGGVDVYHFDGSQWTRTQALGYGLRGAAVVPDGIVVGLLGEIRLLDTREGAWKPLDATLRASTNVGFASIGDAVFTTATHGIWRTTDGGEGWTRVYDGDVSAIAAHGDVLFSFGSYIERSTDLGATWERIDTLIVDPVIGERIYSPTWMAVGAGSVWVTDGYISMGEHGQGGGWLSGGVYRSDDDGKTWQNVSSNLPDNGLTVTPVFQVFATDDYVTVLTASGLYRSSNRGGSWSHLPLDPVTPATQGYTLFGRGHEIIAAVDYDDLYRSTDGGIAWQHLGALPDSVTVGGSWNFDGGGVSLVGGDMYISATRTYRVDSVTYRNEPRVYRYDGEGIEDITGTLPEGVTFYSFFQHGDRIFAGTEGRSVWTKPVGVSSVAAATASTGVELAVSPMPLRTRATLTVTMPRAAWASVRLVDLRGVEVARLHDGPLPRGANSLHLNASGLPAGSYFIRLESDGHVYSEGILKLE